MTEVSDSNAIFFSWKFPKQLFKNSFKPKNRSEPHLIMKQSQRASSKIKGTDWSEISTDEDTDSGCDIWTLKKIMWLHQKESEYPALAA